MDAVGTGFFTPSIVFNRAPATVNQENTSVDPATNSNDDTETPPNATTSPSDEQTTDDITSATANNKKSPSGRTLTEAELQQIQELKARDREVRAHEQAHLAAAGSLAIGGPTYTYQRGPDGVLYAVGGQVNIDTSAVPGDPEATLQKAQRIRAAALAPAEPSSQDLRVAAQAAQLAVQARAEISQERSDDSEEESSSNSNQSSLAPNSTTNPFAINAINDTAASILDLIA